MSAAFSDAYRVVCLYDGAGRRGKGREGQAMGWKGELPSALDDDVDRGRGPSSASNFSCTFMQALGKGTDSFMVGNRMSGIWDGWSLACREWRILFGSRRFALLRWSFWTTTVKKRRNYYVCSVAHLRLVSLAGEEMCSM